MSTLLKPSNEIDLHPGFLQGGVQQLGKIVRGRSLLVLIGAVSLVLIVEIVVGAVLLAGQHPNASFEGYKYGPNVGASVAQSEQFDMPYIESDVVEVSPDGTTTYALAVSPNALKAFDSLTLELHDSLPLEGSPRSITTTADGKVFVLSGDRTIEAFSNDGGQLTAVGSTELQLFGSDFVSQLEISPDGNSAYAILSNDDTLVVRFSTSDGTQLAAGSVDGTRVVALGVAAEAGTVFAVTEGAIGAFDPNGLRPLATYAAEVPADSYNVNYYHLAATRQGDRVFFSNTGEILGFDGSAFTPVGSYWARGSEGFSPNGTIIVSADWEEFRVNNGVTGEDIFQLPISTVWAAPVALPDPAAGFILAPYVPSSDSDRMSAHLARYTSDAPRIVFTDLLFIYALVNVALILVALLAVFLWPLFRRWRAAAPARAARAAQLAEQQRERQEAARQAAEQAREQSERDARVLQLAQWRAAYAELNPGQEIPPMPTTPSRPAAPSGGSVPVAFGASQRTNTMAILALVFGFGGGLLGIIFGHIALRQIARTGESGRGLAIAGLVLGYLGLLAIVVLLIGLFATMAQFGL